jgi:Icc-related predicted phosphoesterase
VALCPFRIALLHYAPITATLEGERTDIWSFLGTDRLAAPLREHHPDLVLHGHAHAGSFEGRVGDVPVYNVSVPVLGEDFWVFEMTGAARAPSEVH